MSSKSSLRYKKSKKALPLKFGTGVNFLSWHLVYSNYSITRLPRSCLININLQPQENNVSNSNQGSIYTLLYTTKLLTLLNSGIRISHGSIKSILLIYRGFWKRNYQPNSVHAKILQHRKLTSAALGSSYLKLYFLSNSSCSSSSTSS